MFTSLNSLLILLEAISLCSCQVSFNVSRHESGDEVSSSMATTAAYCTAIHAYLDGPQCKCNFRLTFSLDLQRCIDYYNGKHGSMCNAGHACVHKYISVAGLCGAVLNYTT